MRYKLFLISIALLAAGMQAGAQVTETTAAKRQPEPLITTKIKLLTRAYGDSIVLRWAAEDYVTWRYLAAYGVNVLRVPKDDPAADNIDTLAYALKPLSLDRWLARYPQGDSVAMVPAGVLYGDAENVKIEKKGSMGRSLEYNSEQDISYAFAMMVAEWRPDVAESMAVRFTDRTARPGAVYDYYIQPTRWDETGRLIFEPGVAEHVKNVPYQPDPFAPIIRDSIASPMTLVLMWNDSKHSSYEIERRLASPSGSEWEGWQRVTNKPYVSMLVQPADGDLCVMADSVPQLGTWEYRILAYDAFANLTEPSAPHRVVVYDVKPPRAPEIKYIAIERPKVDPMEKVLAHVVWENPHPQDDDVTGYCINYSSTRITGGSWKVLNDALISPRDTLYTIDATDLQTGMIYLSAFDESGNEGRSTIQQIRLTDYKAPDAPAGLSAEIVIPEADTLTATPGRYAYVILRWEDCPDGDIHYYDISFANDTTHQFVIRNQGGIRENSFVDSLAFNVNQKYIYYKVRAVDYSTNVGPWSHWLQVKRPHVTPPTQPHLNTSSHNDQDGMHMEWIVGRDADMDYHLAYRRQGDNGAWEVIGRYDADSLRNHDYRIIINDNPAFDREQRYYYYVESFNASPFSSQSLAVSWLHKGPKVWKVDIKLVGDYMQKEGETRMVWDIGTLPFDAPYYYCIYRKGQGDDKFRFIVSQPANEMEYTDKLLRKGEQAEYYVMIQWRDGRQSTISNTVTITNKQ